MTNGSAVDQLAQLEKQRAQLDAQRDKILDTVRSDLMAEADKVIAELAKIGFNYRLVEAGAPRTGSSPGSRTGTRTAKDAPCPVCNFKTTPLHDGRTHRTQKEKRPFTSEELAAKGLTKVN